MGTDRGIPLGGGAPLGARFAQGLVQGGARRLARAEDEGVVCHSTLFIGAAEHKRLRGHLVEFVTHDGQKAEYGSEIKRSKIVAEMPVQDRAAKIIRNR